MLCKETPSILSILLFVLFFHLFHETDVIKFGQISVLQEIRTFVWGHRLDQMFDDLIGDQ